MRIRVLISWRATWFVGQSERGEAFPESGGVGSVLALEVR